MRVAIIIAAAVAATWPSLTHAGIKTDTVRQKAEQACYNNVMAFCNDAVPDEKKIAACLGKNLSRLDPDCRYIYERGL